MGDGEISLDLFGVYISRWDFAIDMSNSIVPRLSSRSDMASYRWRGLM
jgi:hypothetical protein